MTNNTGQVIKQLRINKKLTQEQLAEMVGVTKNSIQKYEDGTVKNLKIDTIRKLCQCFEIPPWLLIFPEKIKPSSICELINFHKKIDVIYANREILNLYLNMNVKGKEKAIDYIRDLNKIPEYKENADIIVPQ